MRSPAHYRRPQHEEIVRAYIAPGEAGIADRDQMGQIVARAMELLAEERRRGNLDGLF